MDFFSSPVWDDISRIDNINMYMSEVLELPVKVSSTSEETGSRIYRVVHCRLINGDWGYDVLFRGSVDGCFTYLKDHYNIPEHQFPRSRLV